MSIDAFLRPINHSETLLINERSEQLESSRRVFRFGFGQSPFPVPACVAEGLRQQANAKAYLPVQGWKPLREAVAAFHRQQDSVDWQPERVLIGPGSKLLIYAVMASFTRAEVLLVSPSWVSYEPQAKLAGHKVSRLQANADSEWRLTPEMLDQFCHQRETPELPLILVLNYPGNPSGTTYSEDQLQALADVLRHHGVLVISDEIYGMLHHQGGHRSLARYYPEGTLVTGGLSKWCGAGGWRLGVLHVPEALSESLLPRLLGVASETWSCVTAPVQYAAVEAYAFGPEVASYVQRQREILSSLGQQAAGVLNEAGISTALPQGGFYLFPDFGQWREALARLNIHTSDQLCERLLTEAGVALLPGTAFGMPQEVLTARLSYVNFDGAAALTAAADEMIAVTQPVIDGLAAIVSWLQNSVKLAA
ncbi:pyridoxal phosphate-dependent aminotransferase [Marinobacterium weihaiense]|uniref:Aminotransferase class I/II-fold pyridoxal phosphate-dependent enzyme n=1 Tax=Marinobacterium weihaiense TaxID=2851016 RepID=A0ABS6M8L8_9GAMM|nr:aminotransferase class I/II-fold pyridoxal phosphate-dependent enzyme [Marinobacterium weihaiense]MBV0932590.1 aminotransferase class I/II-fold pyridoxal phosphate-dependent enzyme [Marinobacterium weihaiense]